MKETPNIIKNSKKTDEYKKNNNEKIYEFLKEENKKILFDKLINNLNENFLFEQKLTNSRQSQIPYFNFNEKPMSISDEQNEIIESKDSKQDIGNYETIKMEETKEVSFGNDIIYGLALLNHYVVAVSKEYIKLYDLKDSSFKEVKSIFIKDVFFLLC